MEPITFQEKYLRASRVLTTAYLIAVCALLPLVFWQMYFDITETKLAFFLGASLLYLLLLLLARLFFPLDYGMKPEKIRLHPAAIALFLLALCCCVGSALGGHLEDSVWGENNRYQGIFTLLVYAGIVLTLAQQTIDPRLPLRALAFSAVPVCLLGVLNHFGVDPLGFFRDLAERDQGRFLSTIGNANFYGSYLCMAVPAAVEVFLEAKRPRARVLSAILLVVVFFGTLVAGSDSTALGLVAVALLFPIGLLSDVIAMRRYLLALALFAFTALAFGLLSRVLSSATFVSAFALRFASLPVAGSALAAALLLWLLTRRICAERLLRLRKPYWITLLALVLLAAIALVLLNTALSNVPLGGAARYLRFSPSWGTDRGKIWMFVARLYDRYTPLQHIFGAGPGALVHADAMQRVFPDAALDTAHNEYLQYLLVSGALGLAAYLLALGVALRSGIRKSALSPAARGLTVALAAYAVQAVVNIAQPMSTPLAFLIVGVLVSRSPVPQNTEQTEQEE
jgi:O-antigen ligase